ncbi:MAG: glycosyltransferase, partial [Methanobacteriota archaeon]
MVSSGSGEARGRDPRRTGNAGSAVPRVSIVIPAFNRLDYTRRCLGSIEHLTYPNFETILIDNGSGDGTAGSVRQEFPWVRVIRNEANVGYA